MKKLLAILCAALIACALALPAFAAEDVIVISENPDAPAVNAEEVIDVSLYARSDAPAAEGIMPISAPVEEEAKDLSCCEAAKLLWEGLRAGEFTFFDILRAPFDILF